MNEDPRQADGQDASERALADEARKLYDRSVSELDPLLAQKLAVARRAAVAAAGPTRANRWGWVSAAATAGLAAVIIAVAPWRSATDGFEQLEKISAELSSEEAELVLAEESLEMIEELEFFEWLATQPETEQG